MKAPVTHGQQLIALSDITQNPKNARQTIDVTSDAFKVLAIDIRHHGLLQPLIVVKEGKGFTVRAGSRRLAACNALTFEYEGEAYELAPLASVPCTVVANDDEAFLAEINAAENTIRADLSPYETAEAAWKYAELARAKNPKVSVTEMAAKFGFSSSHMSNLIGTQRLISKWRKALRDDAISLTRAFKLSGLSKDDQLKEYDDWAATRSDEEEGKSNGKNGATSKSPKTMSRAKIEAFAKDFKIATEIKIGREFYEMTEEYQKIANSIFKRILGENKTAMIRGHEPTEEVVEEDD